MLDWLPLDQLWAKAPSGDFAPARKKFKRIGSGSLWTKPDGGMWTSTYHPGLGSGWVQWCLGEEFAGPEFNCWRLRPDPGSRVYVIDTYDDLAALVEEYPNEHDPHWRGLDKAPHWRRVAAHYDAVHLTEEGQWATRLTHPYNLYGWDCESTLWLDWRFIDVEHLGVRSFAREDDEEAA